MKNKQIKKNFLWNTIGITFNAFNSFFFLIIVNRINGIDVAGMFTYGFATACLLWGISMYYNRVYQVSNSEITDKNFIKFRMLFCLFMILISVIFAFISTSNVIKFWIIILLCLFRNIEALSDSFYGIIHKNNYLDYVGKSLFLKAIIGIFVFLLIDILLKNIILSIIGLLLVNIIGVIIDYKKSQKYLKKDDKDFKVQFKIIFKQSFPIFAYSFLSILLLNCQKYIIGFNCEEKVQTIFGIIIMPATIMSLCGQYLVNPFLNSLTDNYKKRYFVNFKKIVFKLLSVLFIGGILISLVSYFISVPILNIIYNVNLENYKLMISIIIVSATFYSLTTILSACLTVVNKNSMQLLIYAVITIISIIISYLLIIKFDVNGAVYAYCISMIIHFILYFIYYKFILRKLELS